MECGSGALAGTARLIVAGGYGVFGRLLVEEALRCLDVSIVIAGRDLDKARAACERLGSDRVTPLALDLHDEHAYRRSVEGAWAVACLAGPFQGLMPGLPRWTVEAGANWLDIGDCPQWVLPIRDDASLHALADRQGLRVLPGLSTTPALTEVLGGYLAERTGGVQAATITLYIGNRNPKGAGAIGSALLSGFAEPKRVRLPVGERLAYRFSSADRELFHRRWGIEAEFRVAFEWPLANRLMALLQPLAAGPRLARVLAQASGLISRLGSATGILQVEMGDRRVALVGEGQKMAILPCLRALEMLARQETDEWTWASWRAWLHGHGLEWFEA